MPPAAPRPCTYPGCRALTKTGRCEAHPRKQWGGRSRWSRDNQLANDWTWRTKIRPAVLREEPLCRMCRERGLVMPATEVDHIVARSEGGTHDRANLRPLCKPCHSRVTAQAVNAARRARATR